MLLLFAEKVLLRDNSSAGCKTRFINQMMTPIPSIGACSQGPIDCNLLSWLGCVLEDAQGLDVRKILILFKSQIILFKPSYLSSSSLFSFYDRYNTLYHQRLYAASLALPTK